MDHCPHLCAPPIWRRFYFRVHAPLSPHVRALNPRQPGLYAVIMSWTKRTSTADWTKQVPLADLTDPHVAIPAVDFAQVLDDMARLSADPDFVDSLRVAAKVAKWDRERLVRIAAIAIVCLTDDI